MAVFVSRNESSDRLLAGRAVIKVAAVAGEGDKLREIEWEHLLQTVV